MVAIINEFYKSMQVIDLKKKRTVNADLDVFFTEKHNFTKMSTVSLKFRPLRWSW